jgi:hypothetical protein
VAVISKAVHWVQAADCRRGEQAEVPLRSRPHQVWRKPRGRASISGELALLITGHGEKSAQRLQHAPASAVLARGEQRGLCLSPGQHEPQGRLVGVLRSTQAMAIPQVRWVPGTGAGLAGAGVRHHRGGGSVAPEGDATVQNTLGIGGSHGWSHGI